MGKFGLPEFLSGEVDDPNGRHITNFVAATDDELENTHDLFQWVFPLQEPSKTTPKSPILSRKDLDIIRENPEVNREVTISLNHACNRYLRFLESRRSWLTHHDHNHLRITRIIKSLRLIMGDRWAVRFKMQVLEIAGNDIAIVGEIAKRHWRDS